MASEKQNLELRVGDKLNNILTSTKDYSLNFRAVQSMIVRSIMDDPRMAASKGEIVEMIAKIVAEKKIPVSRFREDVFIWRDKKMHAAYTSGKTGVKHEPFELTPKNEVSAPKKPAPKRTHLG